MLLVILGAGASYDSVPSRPAPNDAHYNDLPNRPPLADQLFADRQYFGRVMTKYQECLDIAPRLRHLRGGASIESVLQLYQSEAIEYPERIQQLAWLIFLNRTGCHTRRPFHDVQTGSFHTSQVEGTISRGNM